MASKYQKPNSTPFVVNGFRTEAEADGWIKFQRLRTKEAGRLTRIVSGRRHDGTYAVGHDCSMERSVLEGFA
jgi:hypothetical protein